MISVIIILTLFGLALFCPVGFGALMCLLDATGVYGSLGSISGYAYEIFPVGALVPYFLLWNNRSINAESQRTFLIATIAMVGAGWICFGLWVSGVSVRNILADSWHIYILGVIYGLAYWKNKGARRLFFAVIMFHMALSMAIKLIPGGPWDQLHARNFVSNEGYYGDLIINPNSAENEQSPDRLSAQFYVTTQLSFIGGIGFGLGICLFSAGVTWLPRFLALIMIALSLWVHYATLGRAIWIASFFSIAVVLWRHLKNTTKRYNAIFAIFAALVAIAVYIGKHQDDIEIISKRFKDVGTDDTFTYRLRGLVDSWGVFAKHPFFGPGNFSEMISAGLHYPHEVIVVNLILYGLPCGLATLFLCAFGIVGILPRKRNSDPNHPGGREFEFDWNIILVTSFCTFLLGRSNQSGGGQGLFTFWVCLGVACTGWAKNASRQLNPFSMSSNNRIGRPDEFSPVRLGPQALPDGEITKQTI